MHFCLVFANHATLVVSSSSQMCGRDPLNTCPRWLKWEEWPIPIENEHAQAYLI
ncbi:unnamed protein product [Nesidiocoris tenuis]|uniref:Uncharacterized protein n=1 Tax=Nesidiocoris tenuis TaxID=355587 RepID=A0A6H5H183_9HEMI|nr:unnamed protein product [Nesidiocoris tenuis]CAB0009151.1 unnamed protein product [Nesidiocoris tenuis]